MTKVCSFHVGFVLLFVFGIGILNNMKHYSLKPYVANRTLQDIWIPPIITSLLSKSSI